jgi:hypothetical protein
LSGLIKWLPTAQKALLGSGRALAEGVIKIIFSLLMVFFLIVTAKRRSTG